ncbi:MAG: hypothetical protein HOM84_02710 [Thiotrichales bacterium]|jgi:hypothetical protein|nr:hypothetical protein [Thiotrichales bacterium]MBT3613910.1 hypothetical protein [Thiotrichales bacterium]MBT3752226.1 hypothetical protein [Thiotrichales bacterium]MBT3837770.1 hypothetical protein [Thiotrichales bacterium]MBT4151796.1 hypothetical protein [Thiotrichales bacterium]
MADEDKKEDEAGEEKESGGSMLPLIIGGVSLLLNIAILVYLILFPSGGGNGEVIAKMATDITAISEETLPAVDEKISALAVLIPEDSSDNEEEEDCEDGEECEEYEEDEDDGDYSTADSSSDGSPQLTELTMMMTDTQLIMRQLAENLNTDTASIKRSIGGAAKAGKQVRNLRADLKRIEKKINELLGDTPDGKKRKKGGRITHNIYDYESGGITFP